MITKKKSLKARLLIFSSIIAIGPVSLLVWRVGANASDIEEDLITSFGEYAIDLIEIVERDLFERYENVQAFAANEAVLDREQWGQSTPNENGIVRAMDTYMDLYDIYALMVAVDLDGNVIAANSRNAEGHPVDNSWIYRQNFKSAGWFKDAVSGNFLKGEKTNGTVVEDVHHDPLVQKAYGGQGFALGFSAPIKDRSGAVIGVWTNRVAIDELKHIFEDAYRNLSSIGYETAELTLLDKNGYVIIDLDPYSNGGRIEANLDSAVIMSRNLAREGLTAAAEAVNGHHGATISKNKRKRLKQVAGYAHSHGAMGYKGLGWSTMVRINESEAMGAFKAMSREIFIISAIGLAIAGVMAWSLANKISKPLISITDRLTQTVNSTRESAGGLSNSAYSLADGSTEQAATVEETSASTRELHAMTNRNAESVVVALEEVESATGIVENANSKLSALSQAMGEISSASDETKNIIKTIDEIAFQTNILALNAAVEAARAGEAGAGFAIVADEVRNLAARAAQAAQDTSALLDQNIQKIAVGTRSVDETNEGFDQLRGKTSRISELMREISEGSRQQAAGLTEINTAISQISQVTQRNAAGAEEVASASKELDSQAVDIAASVDRLIALVDGSHDDSSPKRPDQATPASAEPHSRLGAEELAFNN